LILFCLVVKIEDLVVKNRDLIVIMDHLVVKNGVLVVIVKYWNTE